MSRIRFRVPRPVMALGLSLALGLCAVSAQAGEAEKIAFDVELKGITAGQLKINATRDGKAYSAAGVLETTGLVGMLRKIRYTATVVGTKNTRFVPAKYTETADTPKRESVFEMLYEAGRPVKVSQTPERKPKEFDVAIEDQAGTLDPLSALYAVLREVDRDEACKFSAQMFDGARRTQVKLFEPKAEGKRVVCAGEYRRLGGFHPKDMAEKTTMAFTLTYEPTPENRLRVIEIATETIYGNGRLKRR